MRSVDPEFAILLNEVTDDSNVNAIVVFHQKPTEIDIADLRNIGVLGGTRYRELPMIALTAKRSQIISISKLPSVRSIYGNRTLQSTIDPYLALTGRSECARPGLDERKRDSGFRAKRAVAGFIRFWRNALECGSRRAECKAWHANVGVGS